MELVCCCWLRLKRNIEVVSVAASLTKSVVVKLVRCCGLRLKCNVEADTGGG